MSDLAQGILALVAIAFELAALGMIVAVGVKVEQQIAADRRLLWAMREIGQAEHGKAQANSRKT